MYLSQEKRKIKYDIITKLIDVELKVVKQEFLFCSSHWQRTDITVFCHWLLARVMMLLRMHGLTEPAMAPFN